MSARKLRRAAAATGTPSSAVPAELGAALGLGGDDAPASTPGAGGAAAAIAVPAGDTNTHAGVSSNSPGVTAARARAQELLDASVAAFEKRRRDKPTSDEKWMTQVLRSGTMSDKVAAMALAVQHNPMQSLGTLDALLALARKKSRRESQLASDSLFDLFQGGLLPPDRELVRFHEVPGVESPAATPSHLRFWLFEDLLKQRYREFVLLQESTLQDGLVHFKMATLKRAGSLAGAAPEQRRLLVSMVANRLGDVEKKVRGEGRGGFT